MKDIDEKKLEENTQYRFEYMLQFINFSKKDMEVIAKTKELISPRIMAIVDTIYKQIFKYDCSKRHFAPKQCEYESEKPLSLEEVSSKHPLVQFRKKHLARYLDKLITGPYDEKMAEFLNIEAKVHTSKKGEIHVPLTQMSILMGFLSATLVETIMSLDLVEEEKLQIILSFNKLMWLQESFITKQYVNN